MNTPPLPEGVRDVPWRERHIRRGRAVDFRPGEPPAKSASFDFDAFPPSAMLTLGAKPITLKAILGDE